MNHKQDGKSAKRLLEVMTVTINNILLAIEQINRNLDRLKKLLGIQDKDLPGKNML